MARTQQAKGRGTNRAAVERPYVDRYVELFRMQAELREDIKQVGIDAKEADLGNVGPMKEAARRILETQEERNARVDKETETERILRAFFGDTSVGRAAVETLRAEYEASEFETVDEFGEPTQGA